MNETRRPIYTCDIVSDIRNRECEHIAQFQKTLYAFNSVFFVIKFFEDLDQLLDTYLQPIAKRAMVKV